MKKFEYRTENTFQHESQLNKLGQDGWELVHFTFDDEVVYVFKREIPEVNLDLSVHNTVVKHD